MFVGPSYKTTGTSYGTGYPYGSDPNYDDYAYDDPAYGGACYLQPEWVWNGYRHVRQPVRVCQ